MFQNLGFNDIDIFEEVSFHINDILISSTEKDLYLYTLWQDALLEVLLTLSLKRNIFFIFYKIVSIYKLLSFVQSRSGYVHVGKYVTFQN